MMPSREIERLLAIMAALRDPESGCPWDIAQDFRSIVPYTIEEAFEVADAIERGALDELCDELGDLLLQVVFHAQMASERGAFSFGDVVAAITSKMIRRHPHVFGGASAWNAEGAKASWNEIKAREKAGRIKGNEANEGKSDGVHPEWLADVPLAFPALTRALKLQQRAAQVGFDWDDPALVLAKVDEEWEEFRAAQAAGAKAEMHDEFGDILFSLVNLARHHGVDPEDALRATNNKFRKRFRHIEQSLNDNGKNLNDASLAEMEMLWQEAKGALSDAKGGD